MVGLYGAVIFNLPFTTITQISQRTIARWSVQELLNNFPNAQFGGQGQGSIQMSLAFVDGETVDTEIAHTLLESYVKGGSNFPLVLGMRILGSFTTSWYIDELSAAYNVIGLNGKILHSKIDVSLKEYSATISAGNAVGAVSRMLSTVTGGTFSI
jgi:phage protein U